MLNLTGLTIAAMNRAVVDQLKRGMEFRRSFVTIYDQFGRAVDVPGARPIGDATSVRMPARFPA